MSEAVKHVLDLIEQHNAKVVDLHFTDIRGRQHHVSIPARIADKTFFEQGKAIDGSSIRGWAEIHQSDVILMPAPETAILDPFAEENTINLRCEVVDPTTMTGYERDPRAVAERAETYLKTTGIGDTAYFGPEPEFFLFNDVRWGVQMQGAFYSVDDQEAPWNSHREYNEGNIGHRPGTKGGYFPLPPVDSGQDIRTAIAMTLEEVGLQVEAQHHEVAPSQHEVAVKFNSLLKKCDELQTFKYVVHNVAHAFGRTATFMPKPLVGDNGSGMHCHQSIFKNGENLFAGDQYAGLSTLALYYIGGIIKHARALNAFTNPTTNSYKRLVPGFEAPVSLAYSARNRSAAIRIPMSLDNSPKARRIEVRFPDALANPYLAFSAMLMAGLDGIKHKIHPGEAMDKDLYDLPPEELAEIPSVSSSLQQSLEALEQDREFLLVGDVFSNDIIDSYIRLKREEITRLQMTTHPVEFEMYYSG